MEEKNKMRTLRTFDPTSEALTMDAVLERLFQPYRPTSNNPVHDANIRLAVFEKEGSYYVRAAVPGIEPSDLNIAIENNVLTIQGEFKQEESLQDAKVFRREYAYGTFTRSLRLPENVDVEKVGAEFKNGFVTITIPVVEEEKPKAHKIEVRTA